MLSYFVCSLPVNRSHISCNMPFFGPTQKKIANSYLKMHLLCKSLYLNIISCVTNRNGTVSGKNKHRENYKFQWQPYEQQQKKPTNKNAVKQRCDAFLLVGQQRQALENTLNWLRNILCILVGKWLLMAIPKRTPFFSSPFQCIKST